MARNTGPARRRGRVRGLPSRRTTPHVVLGAQDNATQRRVGETIWRWEQGGDGGGVAFDQVADPPLRRAVHRHRLVERSRPTAAAGPPRRGRTATKEDDAPEFYSTPGDDRERRA